MSWPGGAPYRNRSDSIREMKAIVEQAEHILMVTGAGLSEACGIPTLQHAVKGKPFHQWFTRRALIEDTSWFYEVYRDMLKNWLHVSPNHAYTRIAHAGIPVITQNIDGLHIKAGSSTVIELHGSIRELICDDCKSMFPHTNMLEVDVIPICPTCSTGLLRPNVVLEGEQVHHVAEATDLAGNTDVLFIVGTQLRMEPCNQIPKIVQENGGRVYEINEQAELLIPEIFTFDTIRPREKN